MIVNYLKTKCTCILLITLSTILLVPTFAYAKTMPSSNVQLKLNNNSGIQLIDFEEEKYNINDYKIDCNFHLNKYRYAYTGRQITPKVYSDCALGEDYDITYSNNTFPGKGIITITGKGMFYGSFTMKFTIERRTALSINRSYGGTRKISCNASNVVAGDKVKLKLGKKTYTKRIKKYSAKQKITFRIPKQKYGQKYTISVRSKKNSLVYKRSSVIWYTNKLRTGQTMAQVKLNPNWYKPSYKNVYSGYSGRQETWAYEYYDSDGNWYNTAYLYFRNGKLKGWNF